MGENSIIYTGGAVGASDSKGRFVLPLEMRKALRVSSNGENKIYLSIDPDCRFVIGYGRSHMAWLEQQICEKERNALEKGLEYDGFAERELLFSGVEEVNFDDGGRFSLPADVKKLLNLGDALVVAGIGRQINFWDPAAFLASDGRNRLLRARVEEFMAEKGKGK